jgi:hypothetical protein
MTGLLLLYGVMTGRGSSSSSCSRVRVGAGDCRVLTGAHLPVTGTGTGRWTGTGVLSGTGSEIEGTGGCLGTGALTGPGCLTGRETGCGTGGTHQLRGHVIGTCRAAVGLTGPQTEAGQSQQSAAGQLQQIAAGNTADWGPGSAAHHAAVGSAAGSVGCRVSGTM